MDPKPPTKLVADTIDLTRVTPTRLRPYASTYVPTRSPYRPTRGSFRREHHRVAWLALDAVAGLLVAVAAGLSRCQLRLEVHNDRPL